MCFEAVTRVYHPRHLVTLMGRQWLNVVGVSVRPVSRWRRLRSRVRLFRSVRLNLIGWAAIVVLCLAGTGVGYAGSRLVDLPVGLGTIAGALAVLAGLPVLDRQRWGRLHARGVSIR